MISPTGKGIRMDSEGSGEYGASRSNRLHNGVDYECTPGQDIVAPFQMYIVRIAKPNLDSDLSGIQWKSRKSLGKLFYFEPNPELIGKTVEQGVVIGIAQSVSEAYSLPNMHDHVHFRIDS